MNTRRSTAGRAAVIGATLLMSSVVLGARPAAADHHRRHWDRFYNREYSSGYYQDRDRDGLIDRYDRHIRDRRVRTEVRGWRAERDFDRDGIRNGRDRDID